MDPAEIILILIIEIDYIIWFMKKKLDEVFERQFIKTVILSFKVFNDMSTPRLFKETMASKVIIQNN